MPRGPKRVSAVVLVAGLLAVSGSGGMAAVSSAKDSKDCAAAKRLLADAKKKGSPPGRINALEKVVASKCKKK